MSNIYEFFNQEPCFTIKKRGNRCVKERYDENDRCFQHKEYCDNTYQNYHRVCDQIWDEKCDENRPKGENIKILQGSKQCVVKRFEHRDNCVDVSCADNEHLGAIRKAQKIRDKCSRIINKQ